MHYGFYPRMPPGETGQKMPFDALKGLEERPQKRTKLRHNKDFHDLPHWSQSLYDKIDRSYKGNQFHELSKKLPSQHCGSHFIVIDFVHNQFSISIFHTVFNFATRQTEAQFLILACHLHCFPVLTCSSRSSEACVLVLGGGLSILSVRFGFNHAYRLCDDFYQAVNFTTLFLTA